MGLVHRWYDYVQGFSSELVARKIRDHRLSENSVVLDPFCGSGTTLVAAKFLGLESLGVEANPLMAFISEAKTEWDVEWALLEREYNDWIKRLEKKVQGQSVKLSLEHAIPMKSANKWFTETTLREVLIARELIRKLDLSDPIVRKIRLAFSRALFDSSQVSMCPGITFTKKKKPSLLASFKAKALEIVSDLRTIQESQYQEWGAARVFHGDAREIHSYIEDGSVNFIFTSPPYPTDIEYTRQTRAELYFLGFIESMQDVQKIKKAMLRGSTKNIYQEDNNARFVADNRAVQEVAEKIHDKTADKNWGWDYPRMVREYFGDMFVAMSAFKKTLRRGGWCLLVLGDQTCKGVMIPVLEITKNMARELGFVSPYIEVVRKRKSTTHSMSLDESIIEFRVS